MEETRNPKQPDGLNDWNDLLPLWVSSMAKEMRPETVCAILGTRDQDGTVHLYYAGATAHDMIQIATKIVVETEKLGDVEDDPAWEDKP